MIGMRLPVERMRAEPGRHFLASGEEEIVALSWWDEFLPLEGPVRVDVHAFYQEERVFIHLRVQGRIHRRCSRCLKDLVESFDHEEDLEVPLDAASGPFLELRPSIESGVRLGLALRPLCRPDCRGICPRCGADLNSEGHKPGCDEDRRPPLDPRLEKLRELL